MPGPLTVDTLAKCKSSLRQRKKGEAPQSFVEVLTHIDITNKGVTDMENIKHCRKASSVYLYDNKIARMAGLAACRNLTQLCLQHNKIKRMANLGSLHRLQKLRLGHNNICVVEGLSNCRQLQELHIESQRLPAGEKLVFDPRCLRMLFGSLLVLNVSGNRLDDLGDLSQLQNLRQLNLSSNFIRSIRELEPVLRSNAYLEKLWIGDNPVCHLKRYKDEIVTMSRSLKQIDEKEVNPMTRQFLLNWRQHLVNATHRATLALQQPPRPPKADKRALKQAKQARFPSKFSVKNPFWLPPLPAKRGGNKAIAGARY